VKAAVRITNEKRGEMGISIHYRGRLDSPDRLGIFCEKLMTIASSMGWQYRVLDEDWSVSGNVVLHQSQKITEIKGHLGLKGIQLSPPGKSESLDFFFDSEGNLLSPMSIVLIQEGVLAVNRRITHFHRKKSREAGKHPAGVLSQKFWSVPKLRHGLGLLGRKRHGPDMLPIIRRGEIAIFRRQLNTLTTDPSLSKGKVKGM
jgi:hypothetical protein